MAGKFNKLNMKYLLIILLFISGALSAQVKIDASGSMIATGDYPVTYMSSIKGYAMSVQTLANRNAIPSNFRSVGMIILVRDSSYFYSLVGGIANSNWQLYSPASGISGGDTTVFNVVVDSTGASAYRVLYGKGNNHIGSDPLFLYDSVHNKLAINTPNFSRGGNSTKLYVKGNVRFDGSVNVNNSYTLPITDGTAGQSFTTDGAGTISFTNPAAGNYGNLQINRNGLLATPASDSLTYNSSTLYAPLLNISSNAFGATPEITAGISGTGIYFREFGNSIGITLANSPVLNFKSADATLASTETLGWAAGSPIAGGSDVYLSRYTTGTLAVGYSDAGISYAGTLLANKGVFGYPDFQSGIGLNVFSGAYVSPFGVTISNSNNQIGNIPATDYMPNKFVIGDTINVNGVKRAVTGFAANADTVYVNAAFPSSGVNQPYYNATLLGRHLFSVLQNGKVFYLRPPTGTAGTDSLMVWDHNDSIIKKISASYYATTSGGTAAALTMNNSGSGDASGTTFNGGTARTISYNTIGAAPTIGSTSITTLGTITTGVWSGTALLAAKLPATVVYTGQANTYTAGFKQTVSADATNAGLNFAGLAGNPSSLSNGDMWHNTSTNVFNYRVNGTTRTFANLDEAQTFTNKTIAAGSNTVTGLAAANMTYPAYSLVANNTSGSATPTNFTFEDKGTQTYAGTETWDGTPPSSLVSATYRWVQAGKKVELWIWSTYTNAGATNTSVDFTLPADLPLPEEPTGRTGTNNVLFIGNGIIGSAVTATPNAARASYFIRTGSSAYKISVMGISTSAKTCDLYISYTTP
jgi:hypothetical protein